MQTRLTDAVVNITNWHNWYSQTQLLRLPSTETWDGVHHTESRPLIGRKDTGSLALAVNLVIVKHGLTSEVPSRLTFNQDRAPSVCGLGQITPMLMNYNLEIHENSTSCVNHQIRISWCSIGSLPGMMHTLARVKQTLRRKVMSRPYCQATGTGTWDLGPGTWDLGPGNRIENQESRIKNRETRIENR